MRALLEKGWQAERKTKGLNTWQLKRSTPIPQQPRRLQHHSQPKLIRPITTRRSPRRSLRVFQLRPQKGADKFSALSMVQADRREPKPLAEIRIAVFCDDYFNIGTPNERIRISQNSLPILKILEETSVSIRPSTRRRGISKPPSRHNSIAQFCAACKDSSPGRVIVREQPNRDGVSGVAAAVRLSG